MIDKDNPKYSLTGRSYTVNPRKINGNSIAIYVDEIGSFSAKKVNFHEEIKPQIVDVYRHVPVLKLPKDVFSIDEVFIELGPDTKPSYFMDGHQGVKVTRGKRGYQVQRIVYS